MVNKCSVPNCSADADYEVFFYDVYLHGEVQVFFEPHESCPYLCQGHLTENEMGATTELGDKRVRRYRAYTGYPHTHSGGQGFCIYRPI